MTAEQSPDDRLACLAEHGPSTANRADFRPVRGRVCVPGDSIGVSFSLPAPRRLASAWVLPNFALRNELRNVNGVLVGRTKADAEAGKDLKPVPPAKLAVALGKLLAALPDREGARRPYRDLREVAMSALGDNGVRLTTYSDGEDVPFSFSAYLDDVVDWARRLAPKRASASHILPRGVRAGGKTSTERSREQRARDSHAAEDSAEWWIRWVLDPENEESMSEPRVERTEFYRGFAESLSEIAEEAAAFARDGDNWAEFALEQGFPLRPAVAGPRIFYGTATRLLGAPRSSNGKRYYMTTLVAAVDEAQAPADGTAQKEELIRQFFDIADKITQQKIMVSRGSDGSLAIVDGEAAEVIDFGARRAAS